MSEQKQSGGRCEICGLPHDANYDCENLAGRIALAPENGPALLSREQREILYHTEHRAAGGFYCGGGKDMDALVAAGLMESAGRKSFVPDEYFRLTSKGRAALRAQKERTERATPMKTSANSNGK